VYLFLCSFVLSLAWSFASPQWEPDFSALYKNVGPNVPKEWG